MNRTAAMLPLQIAFLRNGFIEFLDFFAYIGSGGTEYPNSKADLYRRPSTAVFLMETIEWRRPVFYFSHFGGDY